MGSFAIQENLGKPWKTFGKPWKTMENLGKLGKPGKPWKTMENLGKPWKT